MQIFSGIPFSATSKKSWWDSVGKKATHKKNHCPVTENLTFYPNEGSLGEEWVDGLGKKGLNFGLKSSVEFLPLSEIKCVNLATSLLPFIFFFLPLSYPNQGL